MVVEQTSQSKETMSGNPKMDNTSLTNLESESELAKFSNRIKVSGGATSIPTMLKKNVSTNAYLVDFNSQKCLPLRKRNIGNRPGTRMK